VNITVMKNAIGALDKLLSFAREKLSQIETDVFYRDHSTNDGPVDESSKEALEWSLERLHDVLLVVLEAAAMPEARASLIKAWSEFTSAGLSDTKINGEFDMCESPPLTFLERMIEGLRMTVINEISSEEAWTLSRLEDMLRGTATLVRGRQIIPMNEHDVQLVMHDYLRACFTDFRPKPTIGGALKNFKPDCGIGNVNAAIEFKFVRTQQDAAIAISGIAEDTAGYKGSKDWTRFYAVIYQAEPFRMESHYQKDLKRIGAATWTTIVVNGPVSRSKGKNVVAKAAYNTREKP
jgi:REase_DpnII-MboI